MEGLVCQSYLTSFCPRTRWPRLREKGIVRTKKKIVPRSLSALVTRCILMIRAFPPRRFSRDKSLLIIILTLPEYINIRERTKYACVVSNVRNICLYEMCVDISLRKFANRNCGKLFGAILAPCGMISRVALKTAVTGRDCGRCGKQAVTEKSGHPATSYLA